MLKGGAFHCRQCIISSLFLANTQGRLEEKNPSAASLRATTHIATNSCRGLIHHF